MGLMTTSCFYVWQEPIQYGPPGGPAGVHEGSAQPGTLDALQEQRQQQGQPETREILPEAQDPTPPPPRPPRQESSSIPVARKVPGREGFVFSPYNNKLIDVKGFPKGSKVRDPHYAASENKFFKVP